nr:MAG TPA: hypothetical protein [Caudoviricetes sp.]
MRRSRQGVSTRSGMTRYRVPRLWLARLMPSRWRNP